MKFWFALLFPLAAAGQDSVRTITATEYCSLVLAHHPVARRAATFSAEARAQLLQARGAFDPKIASDVEQKKFAGTDYFTHWDNVLKVPSWFGPELKLGFEQNSGVYLNSESATPSAGLAYAGISVPVGRGLLIDERRAAVRQAELLERVAEADRVKAINKLLLDAVKAYWDWYVAEKKAQLHRSALELAEQRYEAVRQRVLQGDLPGIDSVEASIEKNNRALLFLQSQAESRSARLAASVHLWRSDGSPAELPGSVAPVAADEKPAEVSPVEIRAWISAIDTLHPELVKLGLKGKQLAWDERLQRDKLKPKLNLEYNLLSKGLGGELGDAAYYRNNYKLGLSFSYPVLLRHERGKLRQVQIKQEQNSWEQVQAAREVENAVLGAAVELEALFQQFSIQKNQALRLRTLRDSEQYRFAGGESSLFLVNTREMNLVNNEIKLFELQAKLFKQQALLRWAAGKLPVQ